jgi:predicted trehalose synthase
MERWCSDYKGLKFCSEPSSSMSRSPPMDRSGTNLSSELSAENVVGSYGHKENNACIKALPNGGRLNRVSEKVGVAYGPHLERGTKASMEATKNRKVDSCVRLVGKQVNVVKKKKVAAALNGTATLKAATAPQGALLCQKLLLH